MKNKNTISAERGKELRGRHPLYSRLSGEVVWGLYEELGYSVEDCGKAMDVFLEQMCEILLVMDALEAKSEGCFILEFSNSECAGSQNISERVIPVSKADWRKFLPPFAVGCNAAIKMLNAAEPKPSSNNTVLGENEFTSHCLLICPLLGAPE